jgi:hypothetical protein
VSRPVVVLDANVLFPARLRDLFVRLAIAGIYRARWSELILDECFGNIRSQRPDLAAHRLERTRDLMNAAIVDAIVVGFDVAHGTRTATADQDALPGEDQTLRQGDRPRSDEGNEWPQPGASERAMGSSERRRPGRTTLSSPRLRIRMLRR